MTEAQSNENKVSIKADNGLHEYVNVEVKETTLKIAPTKSIKRERVLDVYISSPKLDKILLSGAALFRSNSVIRSRKFAE